IRDVEDLSGAYQIDVAADERVFVGAEDRDQHLVQRYTRAQVLFRNGAERVASLNFISRRARRGWLLCHRGGFFFRRLLRFGSPPFGGRRGRLCLVWWGWVW